VCVASINLEKSSQLPGTMIVGCSVTRAWVAVGAAQVVRIVAIAIPSKVIRNRLLFMISPSFNIRREKSRKALIVPQNCV